MIKIKGHLISRTSYFQVQEAQHTAHAWHGATAGAWHGATARLSGRAAHLMLPPTMDSTVHGPEAIRRPSALTHIGTWISPKPGWISPVSGSHWYLDLTGIWTS